MLNIISIYHVTFRIHFLLSGLGSMEVNMTNHPENQSENEIVHLSKEWAKKYVNDLETAELSNDSSREEASQELLASLRTSSAYAWNQTESFLSHEVKRHQINYKLIDPWEISQDIHQIFETAIQAYRKDTPVQRLSVLVSEEIGKIRDKYTSEEPRLIGFVSMQFHYTGEQLLSYLPISHQKQLSEYFKVIDDYLYMPLQRTYQAAAQYDLNATELSIVHQLLPQVSQIAEKVCEQIIQSHPNHYFYSGHIANAKVKQSSQRDAEMFQIYILTTVLEKSVEVVRDELFPLCLMLYPTLNVSWDLVWEMLEILNNKIINQLTVNQYKIYAPYFKAIQEMFSPEILPANVETA